MWKRTRARRSFVLLWALTSWLGARAARAESAPVAAASSEADAPPTAEASVTTDEPARPRLYLATGMGVTWDSTGFVDRDVATMPSFLVTAGAHGTWLGFEAALLDVSASGRFPFKDSPVDRVGLHALVTLRPFARALSVQARAGSGYLARVARDFVLAVGPGYERAASGMASLGRFGVAAAASLDLLSWLDAKGNAFNLRVSARRFWGPRETLGTETLEDSRLDVGLAAAVEF